MTTIPHWADILDLRSEVIERQGHAEGLQMSLYAAVYQTYEVPYRDATYWCDITEPTPRLVGFLADIARRLATPADIKALYQLDQGMGGGKSHALVGCWHMATNTEAFFATDVGIAVKREAESRSNETVVIPQVRTIVLCADHFSPGVARPEFGPATNLHERFLWSLFDGDRSAYDEHVSKGIDKAALKDALSAASQPVLILLDEIMDYALALADREHVADMPGEQAFLNALCDAVDDLPHVAMVIVMIRSDLDEQGYEGAAADFRSYLSRRLERNGVDIAVNEPQDFGAIIRRRIFRQSDRPLPVEDLAQVWRSLSAESWNDQVFSRLPGPRQLGGFADRLAQSYPFHPDLLDLVENDWTQHAGFQQVRSTVEVFSATAYWWVSQHAAQAWVPALIGVGDIPLHLTADNVLSSGVLHGNDRTIVALRQVAQTDVISSDRRQGRSLLIDQEISNGRPWSSAQPLPAVRMATALWLYSVAARAQGKRGATKPELLASVFVPNIEFAFADGEEIFNALADPEEGLGAFDIIPGTGGTSPTRYQFSTTKTLRMFHRSALGRTTPVSSWELIWERARKNATPGSGFDDIQYISVPADEEPDTLRDLFENVDQRRSNRLVILDPRRWMLLNGKDSETRADINAVLGLGQNHLSVDFAASCVLACVNTQRRDTLVKRARHAVAWRLAANDVDPDSDLYLNVEDEYTKALKELDTDVRRAFQHFAYLVRDQDGLHVAFARFESDAKSSLSGNDVWGELVRKGDAVTSGQLSGSYLHQLLDLSERSYTLVEVIDKFWRDPSFPMVPSMNEARRAIFDALRPDSDGIAWALVTHAGLPIEVASPELLLIGSSDQILRVVSAPFDQLGRSKADETDDESASSTKESSSGGHGRPVDHRPGPSDPMPPRDEATSVAYRIHRVTVSNRSIVDPDMRELMWKLFTELADVLDPASGVDVQVISASIDINAATGGLDSFHQKAVDASASWTEIDEDF
ncbi:DUF499 domain-containing protein [Nonomuraea sp. NPDC049269]|uniref:DUF499 domain-containing protein n=1 Tax=Nonomuraea sp. NPDC049269 TaxID=3364349 RepID=UPI003716C7C8